jgi:hypothetical protein
MKARIEIIEEYNTLLREIYREYDLRCLADEDYTYKGRNVLSPANDAEQGMVRSGLYTRLEQVLTLNKADYNFMHAENELIGTTADFKYRLGTLYLYAPYVVKLQDSYYQFNGKDQFYHEPTYLDSRYNREIPVAFETLYKFWQRLMDYITAFFPELLLKTKGVTYFHTVINYINNNQPHLTSSLNFQWIKNFADQTYPLINKHRKVFVHAEGFENQFFRRFLDADTTAISEMEELDAQREDLLPFLLQQMELCLEGYFKAMDFLNELIFEQDAMTEEFTYRLK